MSRHTKLITLGAFQKLCRERLGIGTDEFDIYELSEIILKDLSKIEFDFENYSIGNADHLFEEYPISCESLNNYPVGYEVLENGMPVLFVNAGGDWECPICFCIYYDGKNLRGYIPKSGNVYNIKEKCAYGSESGRQDSVEYPEGDPDKIRIDVINRIKIAQ